jgi:hypothetical protein
VELGALSAAFANGDSFGAIDPSGCEHIVSLGEKPLSFRGPSRLPGGSALSPLGGLLAGNRRHDCERKVILIGDDPTFI